ncbi:MAG: threonine--tRNA ligase [Actinomycetota bacterium]|nr:threonine--tRNA ligase [Actinomycetota bacterium]
MDKGNPENITLVIGEDKEVVVPRGSTPLEVLDYSGSSGDEFLVAEINGKTIELNFPLEESGKLSFLGFDSPRGREAYRHSASHVLAQAFKRLFPEAKLAIGPAIENGFYYDFALREQLTPDDLPRIEKEMAKIIEEDFPITKKVVSRSSAIELFKERGEIYKVELLEEIKDDKVTIYSQGEFFDLCRGPHLASTGKIKAFKLLSIAGAYWRGDEKREMLTRVYGTAFDSQETLQSYIESLKEAEKRDHRKLGRELELFSISDEIGPGLVIYHPKGAILRTTIEDFLKKEHAKRGYQLVITPHIMRRHVWEKSGHLEMEYPMYFFEIEGQDYGIKPMNCPAHIQIYKSRTRGHSELPLRFFELGTVYRHEKTGVLHGLLRVRGFTQDDAHIFCTPEQVEGEIESALSFALETQRTFGFTKFDIALSTRPQHYVGELKEWENAEATLKKALETLSLDYFIDEGEGVFYGPKIDIKLEDAIGRLWQGPTVQFDFNLPRRFELAYVGADNREHLPVMIHRTVLGSLERFMGVLIEHYAGAFPLWLAPLQLEVLPIADRHVDYARRLVEKFEANGIRASLNEERETIQKKIRKVWLQKIPYAVIVGDKEIESDTVSIRSLSGRDERGLSTNAFIKELMREIETKQITGV